MLDRLKLTSQRISDIADGVREVVKLKERGLIKPLTHKELVLIKRELENKEVKNEL